MTNCLKWQVNSLSKSLKIPIKDTIEYFRDGRRISFLIERRIAFEVLKGQIAESEGKPYDVIDKNGKKWEIRCITEYGIYFCPSSMVGKGRSFEESGFLKKLEIIEGYIVSDIERFPEVPFWKISSGQVKKWWYNKKLGNATKISRKGILKLIETI